MNVFFKVDHPRIIDAAIDDFGERGFLAHAAGS
jgi:hypothetical protein